MINRDDVIRMAKESLMPYYWRTGEITYIDKLEHFAALVAEDCAKVADQAEPYQAADMIRARWKA